MEAWPAWARTLRKQGIYPMKAYHSNGTAVTVLTLTVAALVVAGSLGCVRWRNSASLPLASPPPLLGHSVAPYFKKQEEAGESHDFVVYEHEFVEDTARLTADGEDHLRQIAARLAHTPFPVIVEQTQVRPKPGSKHDFPLHDDLELDLKRQQVVVRALSAMGVPNAQMRVVVGPALAPGYIEVEGQRAYSQGIWGGGMGGGYGGGMGGGMGGGY